MSEKISLDSSAFQYFNYVGLICSSQYGAEKALHC